MGAHVVLEMSFKIDDRSFRVNEQVMVNALLKIIDEIPNNNIEGEFQSLLIYIITYYIII